MSDEFRSKIVHAHKAAHANIESKCMCFDFIFEIIHMPPIQKTIFYIETRSIIVTK
jgi:hypothetical protein